MATSYAWGRWEEDWPKGRFRCVFVEAHSQPNGMIHATGLYRAADGDTLYDIDTFRDAIAERTAVIVDANGDLAVKTEFAELLTLMPAFLQELKEQLDNTAEASFSKLESAWPQRMLVAGRTLATDRRLAYREQLHDPVP